MFERIGFTVWTFARIDDDDDNDDDADDEDLYYVRYFLNDFGFNVWIFVQIDDDDDDDDDDFLVLWGASSQCEYTHKHIKKLGMNDVIDHAKPCDDDDDASACAERNHGSTFS